jgi:hypothetical protein
MAEKIRNSLLLSGPAPQVVVRPVFKQLRALLTQLAAGRVDSINRNMYSDYFRFCQENSLCHKVRFDPGAITAPPSPSRAGQSRRSGRPGREPSQRQDALGAARALRRRAGRRNVLRIWDHPGSGCGGFLDLQAERAGRQAQPPTGCVRGQERKGVRRPADGEGHRSDPSSRLAELRPFLSGSVEWRGLRSRKALRAAAVLGKRSVSLRERSTQQDK